PSGVVAVAGRDLAAAMPIDVVTNRTAIRSRFMILLLGGTAFTFRPSPDEPCVKVASERFGVAIIRDQHREIGVAREARLRPGRDREAADQRNRAPKFTEIGDDAAERGFSAAQRRRVVASGSDGPSHPRSRPPAAF